MFGGHTYTLIQRCGRLRVFLQQVLNVFESIARPSFVFPAFYSVTNHHFSIDESSFSIEESSCLFKIHLHHRICGVQVLLAIIRRVPAVLREVVLRPQLQPVKKKNPGNHAVTGYNGAVISCTHRYTLRECLWIVRRFQPCEAPDGRGGGNDTVHRIPAATTSLSDTSLEINVIGLAVLLRVLYPEPGADHAAVAAAETDHRCLAESVLVAPNYQFFNRRIFIF